MGYIYKVTNRENGKIYIGQTRYSVKWRWHTHLYSAYNCDTCDYNTLLHKAIRKYGIDAFNVEVIEECPNGMLDEREQSLIAKYDSFNKCHGYNMTLGGSGKRLHQADEIIDLWNKGYAASEIARLFSVPIGRNTVRLRLLGMGITEEEIRSRGSEAISRSKHKLLYQYDKNGNYLKAFYSAEYASMETKSNKSNISACAAGNLKSAGGYLWSYEKKDHLSPVQRNDGLNLVGKYSKDGNLVEAYISITAASNNNGISRKRLSIACEKEEFFNGYVWKFISTEGGIIHV